MEIWNAYTDILNMSFWKAVKIKMSLHRQKKLINKETKTREEK